MFSWGDLVSGVEGAISDVADAVSDAVDYVSDEVSDAVDYVSDAVSDAVDYVSDEVSDVIDYVSDEVSDAVDYVSDEVSEAVDYVSDEVSDAVDYVSSEVSEAVDYVSDVADEVSDAVVGATSAIADACEDWASDAEEFFEENYKAVVGAFIAPVDKSLNSFKEIGSDFLDSIKERTDKRYDSKYDFCNWLFIGIPGAAKSVFESNKESGEKAFNSGSVYDYSNWLTMGSVDMVKGAFNPKDPLSKEHWENSFGVVSTLFGSKGFKAGLESGIIKSEEKVIVSNSMEYSWGNGIDETTNVKTKPRSKLVGEELDLPWLSDNYKAVDVSGTVKVGGEVRDVSRRVYQRTDIDWDYISSHPDALNRSNRELAKQGNAPFHTDDTRIELHHLTQTEPGGMVEIPGNLHDDYTNTLHGLVEDGGSFRNNPILDKQYNNFNSKYWRWRIKQEK